MVQGDPLTLIDTGIATGVAYERLVKKLGEHGLRVTDVDRVILTHKHIDHIGNAWRIQQESGAEIMIHESEVPAVVESDPAGERFAKLVAQRITDWDVPEDARPKTSSGDGTTQWEIEPAAAVGLTDGQQIDVGGGSLEVIHTPGHTFGSICLKLGRQLFTGDHVLKKTSPNVGGGDMRRRGLLAHFMNSLERMIEIAPEIDTVYPGHGDPFSDLATRCQTLARHHRHRLAQIKSALDDHGTLTVYQVALKLFGKLDDYHVVLGCAEAHSHLEYMTEQGSVIQAANGFQLA